MYIKALTLFVFLMKRENFIGDRLFTKKTILKMNFFSTESQKQFYFTSLESEKGSELGTWWYREHISDLAKRKNCKTHILDQAPELYTSHYRFDAVIYKS